jgi:hypothetical protein
MGQIQTDSRQSDTPQLSRAQNQLLVELANSAYHEAYVRPGARRTLRVLCKHGLAEHREAGWCRLTARGREVAGVA